MVTECHFRKLHHEFVEDSNSNSVFIYCVCDVMCLLNKYGFTYAFENV